ncbi:MAG: division/cell wall cluster transcriptional repressor MraZ [Oscillospiraceae bacterium]|nr:division/cell wall cluster transcriptional repressor MraZ [Oscillospiraceae bacterium]
MEFYVNIDAKGRLNFPSKLREELGDTLYVAKDAGAKCLKVYSEEGWKILVEKLNAAPQIEIASLRRKIVGSRQKIDSDKQGRFVVSPPLRKHAEIEAEMEITVIDLEGYAEIWNTANLNEDSGDTDAMIALAAKYGI